MNHGEPAELAGNVAVNPILDISDSISNNVLALPAAQPLAGQRAAGGFASMLAAAQGGGATPSPESGASVPEEAVVAAPAGANFNVKATQNTQPKKPVSSAASITTGNVVAESVAWTTSQMAWPVVQGNATPSLASAGASPPNRGSVGISVSSLSAIRNEPGMNGQAIPSAPVTSAAPKNDGAAFFPSENIPANEFSNQARGLGQQPAAATVAQEPSDSVLPAWANANSNPVSSVADQGGVNSSKLSSLPFTTELPVAALVVPGVQTNGPTNAVQGDSLQGGIRQSIRETVPATSPTLLADNSSAAASELSFSTNISFANSTALNTPDGNPANAAQADSFQPGRPQFVPSATVETAAPMPAALMSAVAANVSSGGGPKLAAQPSFTASAPIQQVDDSEAMVRDLSVQGNAPLAMQSASPPAAATSVPSAASAAVSVLNSPALAVATRAPARAIMPKPMVITAQAAPIRAGGSGAGSVATSGSATASDGGNAPPAASQTPFEVFFSGAAGATESAASTLPKVMLPGASGGNHNGLTIGSSAAGASTGNTQSAGGQGNSLSLSGQAGIAQPLKDPLSGSSGESPQAAPLPHSDAMAAPAPASQAQGQVAAAAPAPAPMATLSAVPPGISGNAAPKPDVAPAAAPGNPAGPVATAAQPLPTAAPGPVQMAQVVNRIGQSEMRVGMSTSAFGNVEVRTVVHASDVGLTIGSEKGDLRGMLANDMPAIANTLQQQNLRLNQVNFMQGFSSPNHGAGGGGSGSGDGGQQRAFASSPASADYGSSVEAPENSMELPPAGEWRGAGSSLSILA